MRYEQEPFDALHKLSHLKKNLKDGTPIAIFRDNGWGDDPDSGGSSYTIIIDGNGQVSYGDISKECFDLLMRDGYLEHNTLRTYKDRGYHEYLGPVGIGFCGWKYVPLKELTPKPGNAQQQVQADSSPDEGDKSVDKWNRRAALSAIDPEAIRRDERERCADIAYQFAWGGGNYPDREKDHADLRAAILGAEPPEKK